MLGAAKKASTSAAAEAERAEHTTTMPHARWSIARDAGTLLAWISTDRNRGKNFVSAIRLGSGPPDCSWRCVAAKGCCHTGTGAAMLEQSACVLR
jgi:hypothetical protein